MFRILFFILLLQIYGCGEKCSCLKFENNSNYDVTTIEFRKGESIKYWLDAICSDTATVLPCHAQIKQNSSEYNCLNYSWEFHISELPDKELHICMIRVDLLKRYAKERNAEIDSLYKVYNITSDQLSKINWTITYP